MVLAHIQQANSIRLWIILHVILMGIGTFAQQNSNDFFSAQPRILTQDGHLIFQTAENYNITFRSRGSGAIRINNDDLTVITRGVKQALQDVEEIKNSELVFLRQRVNEHVTSIQTLESQVTQLQQTVRQLSSTNTSRPEVSSVGVRILRNKVRNLENQMRNLQRLLNQNECNSNPCRNGGTCEDTFNGYLCRCPSNWQGTTCEEDINECSIYAGTPQACQNGATCQNTQGSFRCQCPPDWYGVICTERHDDCSSASNEALCGHGTCINQPRAIAGQPKYKCLCEPGWTTSAPSPTCDVDVNECNWQHYPCSTSPRVDCFNAPGSYTCGPCPIGFSGNGHTCEDINECLQNNGGCSMAPMVQCINNYGSRTCGPCPPGFQGNGVTCIQFSVCSVNNGGCHAYARCIDNAAMVGVGRECRCPPGYTGSGEGPNGCIYQTGSQQQAGTAVAQNPCQNNPCVNGVCLTVGSSYHCMCNPGFTGMQCQLQISECASLPCQNGGTCIDRTNGYECTCTSDFTGINCETEREACGGYLTTTNGSIRYPSNPSIQYPHGISCAWVISTTPGKVINLTFPVFHLEMSSECRFDFLQINDGPTAGSHPIGRFCGRNIPNISSTHNEIYLWFRSDSTVAADGFQIVWNTTDPVCGRLIPAAEYGTINSPGYPGKYPHNRDCYWGISVPFGKRIKFSFATMKLEHHDNCSFDFLEIRDGVSENSPVLQRYCSTSNPPPIETASSYAWLHFHSDESLSDTGFHITYFSIPGIPGCGGTLTAAEGSFSTPDFPNVHAHNLECDWQIRVVEGERINLVFTSLSIEQHEHCAFDFIEIRDGPSADSQLIGRYCGNFGNDRPLPNVISSSNFLFVRFFADYSVAVGGFRAEYKVVCGGVFRSPTGTFHSPYFPNPYPSSRECIYQIEQPPNRAIILEFEEFDVEGPFGDKCIFDYVEVRDGDSEDSPLLKHLCGTVLPETILATHNYLWIKFKTDDSVNNKGFSASYRTENLVCGGIFINQTSGVITSPSHPSEYPHGLTCKWILKAPPGYVFQMTFLSFILEDTYKCDYDYVELFDNFTGNGTGHSLGRYCGNTIPPTKTSLDNVVTVIFKTDESVSREGFSMQYSSMDASRACGGNYFSEMGRIRSPNYPNNYPHYRRCTWIIQVPTGRQIELNITDFQLENHLHCRYDFLEIRNGGTANSPLIGKYCGTDIPKLIRSHSHQLYLHFESDSSQSDKGFLIVWDGTSTGCGGDINAISGTIISPNYPHPYGHSGICQWSLSVNKGSRIQITVLDLDMDESSLCFYEHLEIKDKGRRFKGERFCGSISPPPFRTNTSQAVIKYRGSQESPGRGFQLMYRLDCNNEVKGWRGVIESPNFPNAYPHNRDCTWVITAPLGNKLNLSFSHMQLESTNSCEYDYVEIKEGHHSDNPAILLGKFCNSSSVPRVLSSSLDKVSVRFVSDSSESFNGFQLEWVVFGCGGELTKDRGDFTSPNYPGAYPPSTVCEWFITVELGKKIELTIEEFNIEASHDCRFDALLVFGGEDEHSPSLTSVCHRLDRAMTVTSLGNHMFVRFQSDYSISGTGFKASYMAVEGGCGGKFTAPTGKIHTPNYPNRYDAHTDCTWLITVQEHHTIRLSFEDFDVEPSSNCTYDYVTLYDGNSEDANLLLTHCGGSVPANNIIRTTSNQLLVRMSADPTIQGKGFLANYTIDCGGILNANEGGQLVSSNDYIHYRRSPNCSWLIKAENPEDRITLTVTHLSLNFGGSNCTERSLRIYDGFRDDDPMIGPFCGNQAPPAITSHGQALYVVLSAHTYEIDRGAMFTASFYESTSACGGTYTSENGAFNSPNYPDSYPQETECIWIIKASPGNKAMLTFSYFNMEDSEYCNQDYVEIHHHNASGNLLGRFCGSTIPTNLTADDELWIKFRSDATGTSQGFTAQYSLLHGNELFGSEGQIASPLYPHVYHNNGRYSWRITVPQFKFVKISFNILEITKNYGECYRSHITIFDGADGSSYQLGQYCGVDLPDPVISSSNQIFIVFQTYMNNGGNRFLLSWQAVATRPTYVDSGEESSYDRRRYDCGEDIWLSPNNRTTFSSPGFPNGYEVWKTCSWTIRTELGYHISLIFYRIDLTTNPNCQMEYRNKVIVFDGVQGTENWQELGRYCHRDQRYEKVSSTSNLMQVEFQAGWHNRTGFLVNIVSECGGEMFGITSEVITSPLYPLNYPISKSCIWKIVIRPGRTIKLSFQDFNIQGSGPTCAGDYLLLRDGGSALSPLLGLGKYCGTDRPDINATHSNQLYIHFYSDRGNTAKGFKLTLEEHSIGCGGSIFLSQSVKQHVISSPNYPRPPPSHIECQWVVIGLPSHRLRLDFLEYSGSQTHSSTKQCVGEFVNVHDGGTSLSPVLKTYCQNSEGTLWSSGSSILLHYKNDLNETAAYGFQATVASAVCGGTVVGQNGYVTSPDYPNAYQSNQQCDWIFRGPVGHYLTLSFSEFKLSRVSECTDSVDNVEIRDFNMTGPVLGRYCGDSIPQNVETSDNFALVKFSSSAQEDTQRKGFKLNFAASTEECGGELTTPSDVITSPNYPRPYAHRRYCKWYITVQKGRRIRLEFTNFNLQEGTRTPGGYHYCYDFVMVQNGILRNSPAIVRYRCGQDLPPVATSHGNMMTVIFYSDGSYTGGGFRAVYTSDEVAVCGDIIERFPGFIISPGFGNGNYSNSTECIWEISNPISSNSSLVFVFQNFSLEGQSHDRCWYDFVSFLFGSSLQEAQTVAMYCGNITRGMVLALPFSNIWIRFKTDYSHEGPGFNISYSTSNCGGKVTSPTSITSPNFPNNYANNVHCAWLIELEEGQQIELEFLDFELENNCNKDYLIIRNGPSSESPQIGKYCGSSGPGKIKTMASFAWIEFHSDSSNTARGFRIRMTAKSAGCGGILHGVEGEISSPDFPERYSNNIECEWLIHVDTGYHVSLTFKDSFDLEMEETCRNDFVEIYDRSSGRWYSLGRKCGAQLPPVVNSVSTNMKVIFHSNEQINGGGFKARWHQACGGVFSSPEGVIYSPGYPGKYDNNLQCDYLIQGKTDAFIYLAFDQEAFELEDSSNCSYDRLEVYRGNSSDAPLINSYCGREIPTALTFSGSVFLRFISDYSVVFKGFKIKYLITECGVTLTNSTGEIQANFIQQLSLKLQPINCTWHIRVDPNLIIDLRFAYLNIPDYLCGRNHIAVYDSETVSSSLLGKYCNYNRPPRSLKSTNNTLTISFVLNPYYWIRAAFEFSANYIATYGEKHGCGGTLNSTSGSLQSLDWDHDNKYEPNLNCIWFIIVPNEKVVKLSFQSFDVELSPANYTVTSKCPWDFLEVRDGLTESSPLIDQYCGSAIPPDITSSSNLLFVKFVSDGSTNKAGFRATYTSQDAICGGTLIPSNVSQVIESPGYPSNYPLNIRCKWILIPPVNQEVLLTFDSFQLEYHESCHKDYLKIVDKHLPENDHAYRWRKTSVLCGSRNPYPYISHLEMLELEFNSDGDVALKGFKLQYKIASCNRTYYEESAEIFSLGYHKYTNLPSGTVCITKIETMRNRTISLYFSGFSVATSDGCSRNYLEIHDGGSQQSNLLGKFCGYRTPDSIFSTSNMLWMKFVITDESLYYSSYKLTYVTTDQGRGCGGNIFSEKGTITSPMYPGNYSSDSTCFWKIRVAEGNKILIYFSRFEISGSTSGCDTNYLALFNGHDDNASKQIGVYCGIQRPAMITGGGNEILIKYVTNRNNTGAGFKLYFYTEDWRERSFESVSKTEEATVSP